MRMHACMDVMHTLKNRTKDKSAISEKGKRKEDATSSDGRKGKNRHAPAGPSLSLGVIYKWDSSIQYVCPSHEGLVCDQTCLPHQSFTRESNSRFVIDTFLAVQCTCPCICVLINLTIRSLASSAVRLSLNHDVKAEAGLKLLGSPIQL